MKTSGKFNEISRARKQLGDSSSEALAASFRRLATDAEDLLKATGDYSAEGVATAREHLQTALDNARAKLTSAQNAASDTAIELTDRTEDYIAENPWKAVTIAASVGMLLGAVIARR
jgi:ElaB/YqjD/DUF883 family membrane-anchored ribosome-binding protein